jgi:hypothetical protein
MFVANNRDNSLSLRESNRLASEIRTQSLLGLCLRVVGYSLTSVPHYRLSNCDKHSQAAFYSK